MKKLKYDNQWEYDTYTIDGKEVTSLSKVKIGSEYYDVFGKEIRVPYDDMGRQYHANSVHYFIETRIGKNFYAIDLNRIIRKEPVYAIEYGVKKG